MEVEKTRKALLGMKEGEIALGGHLNVGSLVKKLKTIAWGLRWSGGGLVLLALLGLVWLYSPLVIAQTNYRFRRISNFNPPIANNSQISKFDFINKGPEKPSWSVPDSNYSIFIPKIEAMSRVISDVSLTSEPEYLAALKQGVAEAKGLAHPGWRGTTYLFAHSTDSPLNFARYNAVFYLLDKLTPGDKIEIVYKGKLYKYRVESREILAAGDTKYLVPQKDREILVLQTCFPPGTSWKRLVVVAKPDY